GGRETAVGNHAGWQHWTVKTWQRRATGRPGQMLWPRKIDGTGHSNASGVGHRRQGQRVGGGRSPSSSSTGERPRGGKWRDRGGVPRRHRWTDGSGRLTRARGSRAVGWGRRAWW